METIEILTIVFSVLALIVSIVSIVCSYRTVRKSLQMSLFKEYTRRYQEITMGLMTDKENEVKYQRLYIDLCSEEYYLNEKGCLPKDVWEMWVDGMNLVVKEESLKTAWKQYSVFYNSDFGKFFDNLIKESNK